MTDSVARRADAALLPDIGEEVAPSTRPPESRCRKRVSNEASAGGAGVIAPVRWDAAPRAIINAAAYTAVDKAESDRKAAHAINVLGPEHLARAFAELDVPLLHVSTDYVLHGSKHGAYRESDPVAPLGVYGSTKEEGEGRVRGAHPKHIVLRTSWVYGAHGNNFLNTMLRLSRARDELRVVADQHGCPTPTIDIARALRAAKAAASEDRGK